MDRVELMSVAVGIAEAGSLSAASRKLRMPVPTLSRKLSELEGRLKTQLFDRSSRRLTLTDAGRSYVEACKRILEQVDDAEREASGEYRAPTGEMTVTSPWGIGHLHLLPLSCEFQRVYPDIGLRLLLTDNVINPVENEVDVSIRIGPLADSSLIATRIGSVRVVVCASPEYLAARGLPLTPADLAGHDCITIDGAGVPRAWPFIEGGQEMAAPIRSKLTVSTSEAAVEAAILGSGLTRVMSYKMEAARRSGALVLVLEGFEKGPLPVHALFRERRPMPLKLRVFLDWLIPRLKVRLAPQAIRVATAGAEPAIGDARSGGRARGRRTGL